MLMSPERPEAAEQACPEPSVGAADAAPAMLHAAAACTAGVWVAMLLAVPAGLPDRQRGVSGGTTPCSHPSSAPAGLLLARWSAGEACSKSAVCAAALVWTAGKASATPGAGACRLALDCPIACQARLASTACTAATSGPAFDAAARHCSAVVSLILSVDLGVYLAVTPSEGQDAALASCRGYRSLLLDGGADGWQPGVAHRAPCKQSSNYNVW